MNLCWFNVGVVSNGMWLLESNLIINRTNQTQSQGYKNKMLVKMNTSVCLILTRMCVSWVKKVSFTEHFVTSQRLDFTSNTQSYFFEKIFLLLLHPQIFRFCAVKVCTHITNMLVVFYCCHYLKGLSRHLIWEMFNLSW